MHIELQTNEERRTEMLYLHDACMDGCLGGGLDECTRPSAPHIHAGWWCMVDDVGRNLSSLLQ